MLFALPICVSSQGISFFEGTWEDALEEAKTQEKSLFVDAYTTWCGPCKAMAKKVFTQESVGEFYNQHFINMKMDMEKEEGMKWGMTYSVSAYPTLYFVSSNGDVIKKSVGGKQPDDLINLGKEAIASDDRSGAYAERFEDGDRDFDMVFKYIKELNKVGKPSLAVANKYFKEKPEITAEQKATLLLEAVTEADSKLFDKLVEVKSAAISVSSKEIFEEKIEKACLKTVNKAIEYEYEDLLKEAITKMDDAIPSKSAVFENRALMSYAKAFDSYDEWEKYAKKYIKKSGKKYETYTELLSDVKIFYKENEKAQENYHKWYDELLKCDECTDEEFINYAKFLSKQGDNKKSIEVATALVEKIKKKGKDAGRAEQFLEYLKQQS